MLTNDEMKPNRYRKQMLGKRKYNRILAEIAAGNSVVVSTQTKAWSYNSADAFRLGKSGSVYVKIRKEWHCIDHARLTVGS